MGQMGQFAHVTGRSVAVLAYLAHFLDHTPAWEKESALHYHRLVSVSYDTITVVLEHAIAYWPAGSSALQPGFLNRGLELRLVPREVKSLVVMRRLRHHMKRV